MFCNACDKEAKDATVWIIATIIISASFTFFLYQVDLRLSSSDSEQRLGHELRRLRTAQTTLPSGVTDTRQLSLVGKSDLN